MRWKKPEGTHFERRIIHLKTSPFIRFCGIRGPIRFLVVEHKMLGICHNLLGLDTYRFTIASYMYCKAVMQIVYNYSLWIPRTAG